MKIGLVSPYDYAYPGGVMAHIFHLSQHLIKAGHEIKIIAPLSSPPAILDKGFIRLGRSVPYPPAAPRLAYPYRYGWNRVSSAS